MAAPWERQPGETSKSYLAFCFYRDQGPDRSLLSSYRLHTGHEQARNPSGVWSNWSGRNRWVERAAAWDDEQDRIRRKVQQQATRDMAERHANLALLAQQKVEAKLKQLTLAKLSPASIATLLDVAVKIERTARGEPSDTVRQEQTGRGGGPIQTEEVGEQHAPDYGRLSPDELGDYVRLTRKLFGLPDDDG